MHYWFWLLYSLQQLTFDSTAVKCRNHIAVENQLVSSFLMVHQDMLGYLVPFGGVEDLTKERGYNRSNLAKKNMSNH